MEPTHTTLRLGAQRNRQANEQAKAPDLLRQSLELCDNALEGETDREFLKGVNFVREQLKAAIQLLQQSDGPAIPLS